MSKRKQFNVMLTESERKGLEAIAAKSECSSGQAFRVILRSAIAFDQGNFCCPTGSRCLVPQLHVREGLPS